MVIKNFIILGERCSGTNFLEQLIIKNFGLKRLDLITSSGNSFKHFYGFEYQNLLNDPDTIVFCIIRNTVEWIDSFFNNPYHVHDSLKNNINNFITKTWISKNDKTLKEIPEDRNMLTGEHYLNIFEMRNTKIKYIHNLNVPNKYVLNYSDLIDNFNNTMLDIQKTFNLNRLSMYFENITTYKGLSYTKKFITKKIKLDTLTIQIIQNMDFQFCKSIKVK